MNKELVQALISVPAKLVARLDDEQSERIKKLKNEIEELKQDYAELKEEHENLRDMFASFTLNKDLDAI